MRMLWLVPILFLTGYAPYELTRVILHHLVVQPEAIALWEETYNLPSLPPFVAGDFYLEIANIWITYIAAMLLIAYLIKWRK